MSSDVLNAYEKFITELGLEDREGQRVATWNLVELVRGPAGESLALQAPTGTGKSVAALLAGVEAAHEGKRTAIGTATVMLSEQYWEDIEKVSGVFPEVSFFVLKGAAHYICGNKVQQWTERIGRIAKTNAKMRAVLNEGLLALDAWQKGTFDADAPPSWAAADSENCKECREAKSEFGMNCEYAVARAKAQQAQVVVTSHAMLMIDLGLKRSVERKKAKAAELGLLASDIKETNILGKIDTFIFDEAHKMNGLVSENRITHWDVNFLGKHNILEQGMGWKGAGDVLKHFAQFADCTLDEKYAHMGTWESPERCARKAVELLQWWPDEYQIEKMRQLSRVLTSTSEETQRALQALNVLSDGRAVLEEILDGKVDGFIAFWCDGTGYVLKEMAIRPWFVETLSSYRSAYISATLGVKGNERYALDTLGVHPSYDFDVDSPFDYASQMEVAEVDWNRVNGSGNGLVECVAWFARKISGGTVVLTGSHKTKEWIAREMRGRGFWVGAQSSGKGAAKKDRIALQTHVSECASGEESMLVGVDTFSTGMNLPGAGLTSLFVHGIKHIREDGPYVAWRKRWIESEGGDGFADYELPEKAIVLEQQIGRLIRTQKDWGAVLLAYRLSNTYEKAVVDLALESFVGCNRVALESVGKRWEV